jgi:hypothetical protein
MTSVTFATVLFVWLRVKKLWNVSFINASENRSQLGHHFEDL